MNYIILYKDEDCDDFEFYRLVHLLLQERYDTIYEFKGDYIENGKRKFVYKILDLAWCQFHFNKCFKKSKIIFEVVEEIPELVKYSKMTYYVKNYVKNI